MMVINVTSKAQSYAKMYTHPLNKTLLYNGNTVMEKYHSTGTYNFDGTIIFQPMQDNTSANPNQQSLNVTLTDNDGNTINTWTYEGVGGYDLVPIAAAYNFTTQRYIVTGVTYDQISVNVNSSWYMVLDRDLNIVTSPKQFALSTSTFSLTSTLVTDVCPVYDKQNINFAFTGVVLEINTIISPTPPPSFNNSPKRLFIAEVDKPNNDVVNAQAWEITELPAFVTDYTYPSRIIELHKNGGQNPATGYLVAGSTYGSNGSMPSTNSAFYFRTDYNLGNEVFKRYEPSSSNFGRMNIGDIHFEATTNDVNVVGSYSGEGSPSRGYFIDKIINVSAGYNLDTYSDLVPTIPGNTQTAVGVIVNNDVAGFIKTGKISTINSANNKSTILATLEEANYLSYYSHIPHLFSIDYSDASMNNLFFSNLNPTTKFSYYPRFKPNAISNSYYPGTYYWDVWYPYHQAFEFDNHFQQYVLGSYGTEIFPPTAINNSVVNKTVHTNISHCYFFSKELKSDKLAIDQGPPASINIDLPAILQNSLSVNSTLPIAPYTTDCVTDYAFRMALQTEDATINCLIDNNNNNLVINHLKGNETITMYNLQGAKLWETINMNESFSKNIASFSQGIYLIKVIGNDNNVQSFKVSK